jgi:hypothetical protein
LTFIETKRTECWKPPLVKFWKREVGALWLPFEKEELKEFSRVKPGEIVLINGYVKWISNDIFALIPTLLSDQIYLFCLNQTERRPSENSYVMVHGPVEWTQITRTQHDSTLFHGDMIIRVYDWKYAVPKFTLPKLSFDYQDFKNDLTYRIEGLEPQIEDFLAFNALSTPAFFENLGGVHLTLYDSTKMGLPRLLVNELRRVIPPDIGQLHTIATPFGKFGLRYKYAHVTAGADEPLTKKLEIFLTKRTRDFITQYDELSLSLHSSRQKPKTIQDPPCGFSDIPTVVPETTSINHGKSAYPDFNSFKYMIIQHMRTPVIEDYNGALVDVANYLENLTAQYGLDATHLTQYGFLNANYNARPTSIIRQCFAYARANNIDVVKSEDVRKVMQDYFDWNFRYVYEIWEDLLAGQKIPLSLRVEYRDILRIMRSNYETGKPGVSLETIKAEAKTKPSETERLLGGMLSRGLLYEPIPKYFRLTQTVE